MEEVITDKDTKKYLKSINEVKDGSYFIGKPPIIRLHRPYGWLHVDTNKDGLKNIHWTSHKDTHIRIIHGNSKMMEIDESGQLMDYWESASFSMLPVYWRNAFMRDDLKTQENHDKGIIFARWVADQLYKLNNVTV